MRTNQDNSPEKRQAYRGQLKAMTREQLIAETKDKIWFSAFASNNLASCYHWQCDFTYDEWVARDGNSDEYGKCHDAVKRSCGY